ncbi:hypothetical protein ACFLXQ_04185 [Chloroflexota bacterium]
MAETIVLIVDDLMFLPKLETLLGNLGYRPVAATTEHDLVRALGKAPVLGPNRSNSCILCKKLRLRVCNLFGSGLEVNDFVYKVALSRLGNVDLFSQSFDWQSLIRLIKGPHKKVNHDPVLGFGPHVDLELRQQALDTGCDAVVGRSAIATQLPQLVKKHK